MKKKSFTKTINITELKRDSTYQRVSQYAKTPEFLTKAMEQFSYYSNIPVYEKGGEYYQLGLTCAADGVNSLTVSDDGEVIVDVIELSEGDIIKFMLAFQYQEHKEERCLAELMMVFQEYTSTPEGKAWLQSITVSKNKEVQYSELFGISRFAAKCYIKITQKGNKKYLEMLSDKENGGLSKAYVACCNAEKKPRGPVDFVSDKAPWKKTSGDANNQPSADKSSDTATELSDERDDFFQDIFADETQADTVEPLEEIDEKAADEYMAQYKKDFSQPSATHSPACVVHKVIAVISDGKNLELVGITDLIVDGVGVTSTAQLQKLPDGNWGLPTMCKTYMLNVQS